MGSIIPPNITPGGNNIFFLLRFTMFQGLLAYPVLHYLHLQP